MKIVHTLLILSAAAAADASPAAPLVDVAGRPAVGNIGQRGRPELPAVVAVATAVARPSVVAPVRAVARPSVVAPVRAAALPVVALMSLARGVQAVTSSLSPLVTRELRPSSGNVMSKRGPR
jgi:hypothetical protein